MMRGHGSTSDSLKGRSRHEPRRLSNCHLTELLPYALFGRQRVVPFRVSRRRAFGCSFKVASNDARLLDRSSKSELDTIDSINQCSRA